MIYFIQDMSNLWIKIGFSKRPKRRFRAIQATTPSKLEYIGAIPGGRDTEAHYHQRFRRFRMWREWFKIPRREVEDIIVAACGIGNRQRQEMLKNFDKAPEPGVIAMPEPLVFTITVQAGRRAA
jgi:Meiotically up-regulated gene 113